MNQLPRNGGIGSFVRDPFATENRPRRSEAANYRASQPTAYANPPSGADPSMTIVRMVLFMEDGTEKVFPANKINPGNIELSRLLEYNLNTFVGRFWKHPRASEEEKNLLNDDQMVALARSQGVNVRTPEEAAEAFGFQYIMAEVDRTNTSRPKMENGHWIVFQQPQPQPQPQQPQPQP